MKKQLTITVRSQTDLRLFMVFGTEDDLQLVKNELLSAKKQAIILIAGTVKIGPSFMFQFACPADFEKNLLTHLNRRGSKLKIHVAN